MSNKSPELIISPEVYMKPDDSRNFIEALERGNRELMRQVPRAEVHNHAGLGGEFKAWTAKEGLNIKDCAHHFPDFTDFQNFVDMIYSYPYEKPTNNQNRTRILSLYQAAYDLALSDGVTYLEPGIDALITDYFYGDIEQMVENQDAQMKNYSDKLTIRPDVGMLHVFPMDEFFNIYETGLYTAEELDRVRLNGFPA